MKSRKFKKNLETNKQLAALIKNQDDFIIKITSDGRIQFINRTPAVISIKETIGQKILDSASRKQNKKIKKAIQHVLKTGKTASYEDIDADSSIVLYKLMISPIKHGGKTIALEFIAKNMNEEKEIEVKLKELEEKYKTLVESAQDQIFMIDKNMKILSINSKAAFLSGKTPAEMVGMSISKIFPKETASHFVNNLKEVFETGRSNIIEGRMVIAGTTFYNSTNLTPVKDFNGKIVAVMGIARDITERKKAEEKLKENEEKWRALTENTNDIILIADRNHKIKYINKVYPGYKIENVIGNPIYKYMPKEQHNLVRASLDKVFKTGQDGSYEVSSSIPKIGPVWFNTKLVPVKINDEVPEVIQIASDITERKKAEDALRESEARYRSYIEVTGQLGWTTDSNGFVTEDIPSWRTFTGQSYEEVKGYGWLKAIHPDDIKRTKLGWENAVKTKKIYEIEYRVRRHDGIYRWFLARGIPIFGKDKSIREWVGTCIDITERKKAEEMLRESEKKFKSFFENSNDAIFVADARTRKLVDCNNKAETLMECPKTKILSMRADKLHPKDKIKETMEGFKKQIEGKIDVVETEVLTKSGKRIPVAINASSIEFNGKNYLLGIFRDITEKKKAYEDIRQKKDELEHFAKFAVDRELKMIELKKEIEKLKREAK